MRTLNLGILAHVDAGKTSLTERLLHAAGVIDEIGSVDDGTTQTDSMALERQRGITIKSAVVSFVIDDLTVNLIDTPGHPDFIAEVDRVLSVLDGAVLVISAVEGVQPQTRILMRALQRLHIPTLLFANKIDRRGARYEPLLRNIRERLTPAIVPMGSVGGLGTRGALFTPYDTADAGFTSRLVDLLDGGSQTLLAAYVDDATTVSYRQLRHELAVQAKGAIVHPVFFGSAMTGAGVDALSRGIKELLPADKGDADAPVSGTVFKVERGPAGEKVAYVRMLSGTLRTRDRLHVGEESEQKVTAISVFDRGATVRRPSVAAGQIGKLWGLSDVQIGDALGVSQTSDAERGQFPPPTLETVVVACRPADKGALHVALVQLAEQDPLINVRRDEARQEISVSLYGEVQKEVIEATLANDFGIDVVFRETTTICIERLVDTGAAFETIYQEPNPFLATVGLRVEPAATNTGIGFALEVELGSMPYAFFKAVEESVKDTLHQGLFGWQVTDCTITITHSGYAARQSHAHGGFDKSMSSTGADFRNLTPLVLMGALQQAGTGVYEPVHAFHLEVPEDAFGSLLPVLARLGAVPQPPTAQGATYLIEGEIPAARVHQLERQLPSLTSGECLLESTFDHYRLVSGQAPTRSRSDHNPLNRKQYLRQVARRVTRGEEDR
jgi:ribosomal protection tetracycline resistance protein